MFVGERPRYVREDLGENSPYPARMRDVALVVAPGPDLLYMYIDAPDRAALEAVWDDWLHMVRSVRITETGPLASERRPP